MRRTDIQALRGWAVLVVVLFHLDLGPFAAGYLGVDVFFVISGFLITSLIATGIEHGAFSLGAFYFRRAKRLLPAACVTIAVTALAAPWCLGQRELQLLAWQVAGALSFTANLVLWQQAGYFDTAAELKPLLHTWSLSLEEQFYLLLPSALLWVDRRRWLACATALLIASLVLYLAAGGVKPVLTFYLLPTRAWELLSGSVGALWLRRAVRAEGTIPPPKRALRLAFYPAVAVLLILPSLSLGGAPPGLANVLVCAATLTVILRRHPGPQALMPVRGLARVGDLSYSLYLVHWPLLALLKNLWANPSAGLPLGWRVGVLGASVVLAAALYRWIEAPIHHARLRPSRWLAAGAVMGSLLIAAMTPAFDRATRGPIDFAALRRASDGFSSACDYAASFAPKPECRSPGHARLLVWGDSFAMHLVPGLAADPASGGLIQATMNTCGPFLGLAPVRRSAAGPNALDGASWARHCIEFNDSVLAYGIRDPAIEVVVLSSLFTAYVDGESWLQMTQDDRDRAPQALSPERSLRALLHTAAALRAAGKRVVLLAPPPVASFDIGECQERQLSGRWALGQPAGCRIQVADYRSRRAVVLRLLTEAEQHGLPVIRFDPWLCDARVCQTRLGDTLIYRDYGHFTDAGSRLLDARMHLAELIDRLAR